MKKYLGIARAYMKAQLIWRADVFVDVILSVAKILFAWILWSILFEDSFCILFWYFKYQFVICFF